MSVNVNIDKNILTWAIARAGYDFNEFTDKNPKVKSWIDGVKSPTFKQLEDFSKKVHLPFGYLFLEQPLLESSPIPFFRTNNKSTHKVSLNIYDTILLLQQRQDWLKGYLIDNGHEKLQFVGKFKDSTNVKDIVEDIFKTLGLKKNWASYFDTWENALNHLIEHIEDKGIITVFNGVFDNSTLRKIPVEECRGFVLVDDIAPFMFINNADSKAAQMFTIVHELAHIWTGYSAGFDFRKMQPADNPIETLCDLIAAEFLVAKDDFIEIWRKSKDYKVLARYFKVSEIVIARRALDIGLTTKHDFYKFYEEYIKRDFQKRDTQSSGGDFYATTRKRLSITFAYHVNNAVKSGQLLYRDAYKLTSLRGNTFENFISKQL